MTLIKTFCSFLFLITFLFRVVHAGEKLPQRIISLGPVITEEMFLLGSEDRLVGTTVNCQRPEAARYKDKVGNVQEINLEKIVALKPDLVLATVLTDPKVRDKMRALGIRVIDIPNAANFEQMCQVFLQLGEIVGKKEAAMTMVIQARKNVAASVQSWQGRSPLEVFVQVGKDPLVTIGRDTFVDDLITLAGGLNIVRESGYLQYSRERVMARDPDIILISNMGFSGDHEKKAWERFPALKAVRQGHLFVIDEYLLCSPTPVSFVETLQVMINKLHPEVR